MLIFSVYTYQFNPLSDDKELDLFLDPKSEREAIMSNKNKTFKEVLLTKEFRYRNKIYNKNFIFDKDEVVVLKIANHRTLSVEREFKKEKEYTEPSVLVIFDNRDTVQRLLIQQDTKAFADTSDLARILNKSLNTELLKKKLHVSIQHEYQVQEFWNYINSNNSNIQMVRFEFKYPNLARAYESVKKILSDSNKNLNSNKTAIEYEANSGEHLIIDKNDEFISDMVEDSSNSGNPICLKINGFKKIVKTGNTEKTTQIDELVISAEKITELKDIISNL